MSDKTADGAPSPVLFVELPMALPSASNLREHPMARHRRVVSQRAATRLALKARNVYDWLHEPRYKGASRSFGRLLYVNLTRISPRRLDDDNLQGAFKGVRDEVAAYLGVDDDEPWIVWNYMQAPGKAAVCIKFEVTP